MSRPAGCSLPAGFPSGSKAPFPAPTLNAGTTIILVLLLLRDLLTLCRSAAGERVLFLAASPGFPARARRLLRRVRRQVIATGNLPLPAVPTPRAHRRAKSPTTQPLAARRGRPRQAPWHR